MDSYSLLLERIRVPQPSMQRYAVISIFEKLRSAPSNIGANSDSGRDAISQCLHSTSAAVVDQSVRELCRFVKEGYLEVPHGLLELQSALDGCDSRFVNVFVKGLGFLVRFAFQKNDTLWRLDSPETHPFVKVVSCRTEVQPELVQQVLLLMAQNKRTGLVKVCKFLRPFLNFSILRVSSSASSFSFTRLLVSSIASLSCSFPFEAMPIVKLMMEGFKYFPRKNAEEMKNLVDVAEYLMDAFTVILRQVVGTGSLIKEAQLCSVELLETLLSFYTDFHKLSGGSEPIFKLSKSVLLVQKELGLPYIPELLSVKMSLFLILTQAEFEHEQLSVLKLAVFLFKWKIENEYVSGEAASGPSEEFLFLFPVISLLSSPSKSVKAAATGFLSVLEELLMHFSVASKKVPNITGEFPFISKPESIIRRLLRDLWLQDPSLLSTSYFLSLASIGKTSIKVMNDDRKPWMSQLREYSLRAAERKKSPLLPQLEGNLSSEMPFLLSSINAVLVMHNSLGSSAIDSLAAIGLMDPRLGIPLLLAILFYNKVFCNNKSSSREISIKLLEVLPSLASHSVMIPLIVQTILPMLHKEAKPVLYATAIRLLCKTWEVTDRVFGNLQVLVHPKRFSEFMFERNIYISMAASVRDVCRKNPDRGVDLILSVSACIESQDPTVQTLGFQSLSHLCEADVVDFYTAWDVIAKHVLDYTVDPVLAHGICTLLRWGAMDAEAYSESSKSVLQTLWQIGGRKPGFGPMWTKARVCAFESLIHYEVDHIQKSIPDFKKRNVDLLISEDNADVLRAMVEFEVKIITFEHINRRRLLKEKRTVGNKVEKLLDIFPQVIAHSGIENSYTRDFPGAALLLLPVASENVHNQRTPKELSNLHTAYENALVEVAESLQLSRNILVALLSLQSWKPFMQRWMRAVFAFVDAKLPSTALDKTSKIANDILKSMCRIAEESIPRCAENIALAIGAFCMVLPPSAHAITATASKFLLKWLFQYEHEYRQWSAAIALGLVSRFLHATDRKPKFQIIAGLLEVALSSKNTLVKGACGVGLGFTCEDLSSTVTASDDSDLEGKTDRVKEANLLGKIVRTISLMICQHVPSSSDSLQSLLEYFPLDPNDNDTYIDPDLSSNNHENLGEDLWGVAGLILGLGNSISAIYRYGAHDAVLKIKSLFISWIPCLNAAIRNPCGDREDPEIPLSVGSCLALPIVVAFCQRVELIGESEVDHLVAGYKELIGELLSLKKSGTFHQSLLMASCIGAGSFVSCILSEGVHPIKVEDVMSLLEMLRKCYTCPYPPIVYLGGMLGVVNVLGASAGTLTFVYPQPPLRTGYGQKDSSYIREPILASPVCEPQLSSLVQEIFLVSRDSKDQQLQRYAAWALAFLRHRWWSKELQTAKHGSQSNQIDSGNVSQSFPEDSVVWKLCMWLMNLNSIGEGTTAHVNTVATVLRSLSRAPRLPSLDWGVIIRRCMRFGDQISGNLCPDPAVQKVTLREDCILFSLAHANQINPLLLFLDELSDLSRFRTLELNLQLILLCHLADLSKIFSVSRLEKLFDDMADYIRSPVSSYHAYNSDQKSLLRISFWKGLNQCLDQAFAESQEYVTNMEKCMEFLFASLPVLPFDATIRLEQANCMDEWSEGVTCLGKAPRRWLMDLLEVPEGGMVQGSHFTELVKRIQARTKLVMIGSIPLTELGKLKASILNTESDGIWDVLVNKGKEKKMAESVLYIAEKLGNLLIKEAEFLHKVKKEVESLSKELKALGSDLKKADVMTNKEEEYDEWVSQLRDLAFKAEDVIEVFVNNETQYDGCNVVQLMMGCICQIITLHKLKNEIDDINIKLKDLPKKSSPFTIQSLENGGETSSIHHDREEDQLVLSRAKEDDDIVGFQKEANKLASSLTKKEPQGQLFVVSLWGQAGAGKTALARNIYKRSDVKNQFNCVAWVSVSPDYHVEDIWQAILEQVKNLTEEEKEKLQGKKSVELLDIVYDWLKEKNYLIVLDDLWKQTDWEMISMAFPKSQEKKCRVLLTTRIEEVARAANPSTDPEILRVLNDEESLELFLKKVFGCSLERIPEASLSEEMKDVARQMLSKCEGLPIAIVLLGGILSAKRKDIFEWTNMLEKVRSDLAESTDLRKLFSLSYNELPYASKPCFLYFGLFPEDSVIECDKLIRLWVAEGFIEQRDDKIMEDMARDRLKGLIQRSMIQVVECKSDGDPQTCRTHDLVRSLAIQEAKKAKFSSICKKKQLEVSMEGSCRRIALHPQDFEFHIGTSTSAPFQSIVEMNADLVGVKEEVDRLVMLLTQEEPLGRFAAVSIVGMGGLGKTTLARNVYNKIEVKSYFPCRAWVNVSRHYKVRDILKIILQQVKTLTDAESKIENEDVLRRMLHYHFKQQQSFLVVLDDIWRTEDWNVVRNIFPEPLNSQNCRVLLTSRSEEIAHYVSPSRVPFLLRPLNNEESLKLLMQTIFKCSLDERPEADLSEEIMDIAHEFVMFCAGVPLAIVLLGGLLSVKRKDAAAWVNILHSLKMIDSHFIVLNILYMAYNDLPDYLKSCLLSLRLFPEDTEMACDTLIRLWDVEGFLKLRDNYTLENAARDYLEELIQRKLIEVAKRKLNGSPETCRIHDLLRDFVSNEARKAEFFKSSENEQLRLAQGNRPLALHSKDSTELVHEGNTSTAPHFQATKTFSLMDDILSFLDPFKFPNHVYSLLCLSKNPQFCFQQFQSLRVLDLQGAENIMEVPKEIRNLTLLRYLSLRDTRVKQIPSWIANLRNLQTLDAPGSKIPIDTLKLNQLRHLFAHSFYLSAPAASSSSSSSSSASLCIDVLEQLETLELADVSDWEISGLHKLTYLRILRLRRGGDDTVLMAVANLMRLKFLSLTQAKVSSSPMHLPSLSSHKHLNEIVVEGTITEANDFPPHLTYLWLENSIGVDTFFRLQKLQYLKRLCLRLFKGMSSYVVHLKFSKGGFGRLEFLYIKVDFELENWTMEEGALPSLSVLHIEGGNRLGKLPDGLSNVKTLKELIITRGYDVARSLRPGGEEWEKVKGLNASIKILNESQMNP